MYNLKVIHYENGDQLRVYSDKLLSKGDKDLIGVLKKEKLENDEQIIKNRNLDDVYNPFTNSFEVLEDLEEISIEEKSDKGIDRERSLKSSLSRTVNNIYSITRSNNWEYFITLTFDRNVVNAYDYDIVVDKLSKWINNIKQRYAKNLKYIIVPELHKDGAYHFHGLIADCGNIEFKDSGKKVTQKFKDSKGLTRYKKTDQIIYNIGNYNLGFSTATKIVDTSKASNYICKYITKELCKNTFGKKRYWNSRNLNLAEIEEYHLNEDEMFQLQLLLQSNFLNNVNYSKSCEGTYVDVQYIELDCNIKDLIPDMELIPKLGGQ